MQRIVRPARQAERRHGATRACGIALNASRAAERARARAAGRRSARVNPGNRNQRAARAADAATAARAARRPTARRTGTRGRSRPADAPRVPSRRGSARAGRSRTPRRRRRAARVGVGGQRRKRAHANAVEPLVRAIARRRRTRSARGVARSSIHSVTSVACSRASWRASRQRDAGVAEVVDDAAEDVEPLRTAWHRGRLSRPRSAGHAARRTHRRAGIIAVMQRTTAGPLTIDVVSDVVCPWCFIGKRHLEAALAGLPAVVQRRRRALASVRAQSRPAVRRASSASATSRRSSAARSAPRRSTRACARPGSAPASRSISTRSCGSRTRATRIG